MKPLLNPIIRTTLNFALSALAAFLRLRISNQSTLELVSALIKIPEDVVNILSDNNFDDKEQLLRLANELVTDSLLKRILMARAEQLSERIEDPILSPLILFSSDTLQKVTAALTDTDPNNKEQLIAIAQQGIISPDLIDVIAAALRGLLPEEQSRPLIMLLLTNIVALFENTEGLTETVPGTVARAKKLIKEIDAEGDPLVNSQVLNEDMGVIGLPARQLRDRTTKPVRPGTAASYILGNRVGTP